MKSTIKSNASNRYQFYKYVFALILALLLNGGTIYISYAQSTPEYTTSTAPGTVTKLAAGNDHTCALMTDGTLQCWGDNADGQVGDGTDFPSRPPRTVIGLNGRVVAIATGGNHSCALLVGGTLNCWGRNSSGQLGDGTTDERLIPVAVVGLPMAPTALAGGDAHSCALFPGGALFCWGNNSSGQLGNGTTNDSLAPVAVMGLATGVVEIVAGFQHSCARLTNGDVHCWGDNSRGQLGNDSQNGSNVPVTVVGLSRPAIALAAGFDHTCAVLQDGDVECWGDNARGQLGDGTRDMQIKPVAVQELSDDIASLAAGRYHTCALAIDGDVHCWGSSNRGQLGNGSLESSRTPIRVRTLGEDAMAIAAGEEHTCAILQSDAMRCWGSNRDRQLGEGSPGLYSVPRLLIPYRAAGSSAPLAEIPLIVPGRYHTCLTTTQGAVQCWGRNSDGQLGNGSEIPSTTPVAVTGLESGVVSLALGAEHSCALHQSGVAFCWGSNQYGQLGNGGTDQQTTPTAVVGPNLNGTLLTAGANHTCVLAILGGGTVLCWGANESGQLGNGRMTNSPSPETVSGLRSATAVQAGFAHTCALVDDGIKCWGANESGQLGDGSKSNSSTPLSVTGLPSGTITSLATGDRHSCANVENQVYCWGNNRDGQLGDGTTIDQMTPVAVQGINGQVVQLSAGASHSCALTIDQALYCWGGNEQSQLGDGSTEDRATALIVSGLAANVRVVATGGFHNCVLVTDNRPLCWGGDSDGQLATGVLVQSTIPVALGDFPVPTIDINTVIGQPGSTFTLIGYGFAYSDTLPIAVNDTPLTTTIPANPSGEFIVYVTTDDAEAGAYTIAVGNESLASQTILLQPLGELWQPEGGGTTVTLSGGIGRELSTLYLPVVARSASLSQ